MSSRSNGGGDSANGGHDGGQAHERLKSKKGDKRDKCKKCKTLLPIMHKMKDLLLELQPKCNQYRLELEAIRAENEKLRRRLVLAEAAAPQAPATGVAQVPSRAKPLRRVTEGPSSAAGPAAALKKKVGGSAASAQTNKTQTHHTGAHGAGNNGDSSCGSGSSGGGYDRDSSSTRSGRERLVGGKVAAPQAAGAAVAAVAAATVTAATATARGDLSKGKKIRDWSTVKARQKRRRAGGSTGETAADGAAGVGGRRADSGHVSDGEDVLGESAEPLSQDTKGLGGASRKDIAGGGDGGDGSGGSGGRGAGERRKVKKTKKTKKKEATLQPAGVFAAATFSFLDDGKEAEEEDEEDEDSEDESDIDQVGESSNRRRPRKRSRTAARGSGANGGLWPRTSRMTRERSFRPRKEGAFVLEDEGGRGGWGEEAQGSQQQAEEKEEEVEWYDVNEDGMEGLGWSQAWRRGDAVDVRGGGGRVGAGDGDDGDGLDEAARAMAQECWSVVGVAVDAEVATDMDAGDNPIGPRELSALLRLELAGKVTVDGVLMAVLRGRSLASDTGCLGRLALQLVEGIDAAHTSPMTDPDVLTLVIEELEGVADVIAAAASAPGLGVAGWGRETCLAVEFLTKTLLEGIDEDRRRPGDADDDGDTPGGFSSMTFGNSKKKKKQKAKANKSRNAADIEKGGGTGDGESFAWSAEAEASVLRWWEIDDAARVPWGVARLLGLLLRRFGQPERTESILHSILVRTLGGPSRLLRFPLAFLEAFPGFFLPSPAAAAAANSALPGLGSNRSGGGRCGGEVLAPGLWRRAVTAALTSLGVGVSGGSGGAGGGGAGQGRDSAVVSARLALVCFGGGGGDGSIEGGGGRNDGRLGGAGELETGGAGGGGRGARSAARLGEEIAQAISALHDSDSSSKLGGERRGCGLCRGVGNEDGGDCGKDDALAMSTGLSWVGAGTMEPSELAAPTRRGELIAVEALRSLRMLGIGGEIEGVPVGRLLEPVIRREGVCQRAAALACHAWAQCAGAGQLDCSGGSGGGGGGGTTARPPRFMDMKAVKVARVLKEAVDSDPEKWEDGQEGVLLSHGAKAQAASALLSLIKGRHGELAAEVEEFVVEWTQNMKPKERLSTPLPLLLSVTGLLSRPPAHVINLARRPYRWKAVLEVARREGVLLYRHDAVDSTTMEGKGDISEKDVAMSWATELNTIHDKDCAKETTIDMHPTERACAASHLNLWKRHKLGNLAPFMPDVHADAVLILEDDAKLQPGFLECAKAAMLQAAAFDTNPSKNKVGLKKAWDIIYLGHILPIPIMEGIFHSFMSQKRASEKNSTETFRSNGIESPDTPACPPSKAGGGGAVGAPGAADGTPAAAAAAALGLHVAPVTYAWGLHAYLLTREAAARLVANSPVSAPADIFVGSFLAATDSGRPMLAGRAVLPALATTSIIAGAEHVGGARAAGSTDGGTAAGDLGDVVSSGTRRAGVAHGVWSAEGLSGRSGRPGKTS